MRAELDLNTGKISLEVGSLGELRDFIAGKESTEKIIADSGFVEEPESFRGHETKIRMTGRRSGKRYPRHRKGYNKTELLILKDAVAFNKDYKAVARVMGRKPISVYNAMWRIRSGRFGRKLKR